jgi:hypothetical protein
MVVDGEVGSSESSFGGRGIGFPTSWALGPSVAGMPDVPCRWHYTTAAASPSPQTRPGPHFCLSDTQRTHDTPVLLSSFSSHTQFAKKTTTTVILSTIIRRMAFSAAKPSVVPQKDLESFQQHLNKSTRILALLGAGLSASSGLPTFRGAGGMWRTHDATSLATPQAFERNPGLVWQFYSYRRHMALKAKPNPAHYALAELARKKENFITLSQNVDGEHP